MGFVVLAVGVLMSVVGAYEIYYGNSVIAVERGWSAFIGGSVLFAGGIVTAAIGLAIHVLLGLRARFPVATGAAVVRPGIDEPARLVPQGTPTSVGFAPIEPASPPIFASPPASATEPHRLSAIVPAAGLAVPLAAHVNEDAHAGRDAVDDNATHDHEATPSHDAMPVREATALEDVADDPVPPPTAPDHHPADFAAPVGHDAEARDVDPVAEAVPATASESHPPPAEEDAATVAARDATTPHDPPVIGRYESEGTSYVMYADGSIDAQSSAGVYRFASMAELKAFIET